jgi:ribosomal RNA-processing protein 12
MEEALAKIRPHTTSNLTNQKTPAKLLVALESTFDDQKTDATPTAYLAVLLTTLEGTLQKKETGLEEGDILPAELYLLSIVAPHVPAPVIRSNLNTILSLTSPLFPILNQQAPPLKSQLSLYLSLFKVLDKPQLDVQGIRQAFASILILCIDGRPKVRKRAAEVVREVLGHPPSPLNRHPYAERVSEWIKSALTDVAQSPLARKGSQVNTSGDTGIHILAFLRTILTHLPPSVS